MINKKWLGLIKPEIYDVLIDIGILEDHNNLHDMIKNTIKMAKGISK